MKKVIIAGGPHSGKSTLFKTVQPYYPDAHFIPEAAEIIITGELEKERQTPGYIGILPRRNYLAFRQLVVAKTLADEASIPADTDLSIQDRSLIDQPGYDKLAEAEYVVEPVARYIRAADYTLAIFCDFIPEYQATEIREEDAELAHLTGQFLLRSYQNSGIPMVRLPVVSIEERVTMFREIVDGLDPQAASDDLF